MHIELTSRALAKAEQLSRDNVGLSLRLYLEGKGCDGFYYGVSFDRPSHTDHHFSQGEVDLIVDADTMEFVAGSVIDWVDDDRGKGFLVNNPNHKKYRGKFYKKSFWQERLAKKSRQNEAKKQCK